MEIQPYLMFDGRCDEAIEFYKKALGAEVQMLMRFKDAPPPPQGQGGGNCPNMPGDKVMHANLRIGDSTVLMSDGQCGGTPKFEGVSLSITPEDDAKAKRVFEALSQGGQVQMPLSKTFFSSSFGMVADKFGVGWMVLVAHN